MKILNITIKAITVFLLAGALFFSCALENPDTANGTLVIALPGSNSARTVEADDPDFLEYVESLSFRVDCASITGAVVSKTFEYGKRATFSLAPGAYFVTITALEVQEEEKVVGTSKRVSVRIEDGKTTRPEKIGIEIEYKGKEIPIDVWPDDIWTEYDFGQGLIQPANTTFAYLFTERDTLTLVADSDLQDLSSKVEHSAHPLALEGKKFLLVKIEGVNDAITDADYDSIYSGLWTQITTKGFKQNNTVGTYYGGGPFASPQNNRFRWNIFPHSTSDTSFVYQYMNSNHDLILLVVKDYESDEVLWEDYGLSEIELPVTTSLVYVSYDPVESNAADSKLQTVYGMRAFHNTDFPQFFAVVFIDNDGSIFNNLKEELLSSYPLYNNTSNTASDVRINKKTGDFTHAIDLYRPAGNNYTIMTVRQGEGNWYN